MDGTACEDCAAPAARVRLDGVRLCDRCADRQVALTTGYPELPEPPPPLTLLAADGTSHTFAFRLWRAPTGIEIELDETGSPDGVGRHFAVLGAHDANIAFLVAHVTRRAEEGIARQDLEPNPHGPGWVVRGDDVEGRLVWSDAHGGGGTCDVVVDGHLLTWDELGRALGPFEGSAFRLVLEDRCEDLRPDDDVLAFAAPPTKEARPMPDHDGSPTIDEVLAEFLADQEKRLAARTSRNYNEVIGLLRNSLNSYGHQNLDATERQRWESANENDEEAFVHVFGPDKIADNLGEFLGYFMIRKVMAGDELLRAAGTVTKKLVKWLGDRGHLDSGTVDLAIERSTDAARELPTADKLTRLLLDQCRKTTIDPNALDDDDYIEDYLMIDRVEPGALWFAGGIGPVAVPTAASNIAQPGWSVTITLGRTGTTWHVLEVGNVYP